MQLISSADWIRDFTANRASWEAIPWSDGPGVTLDELRPILRSIQAWQLGETSDGRHLREAARRYALASGDADFPRAVECFIVEEQTHGEALGRFLDQVGAPRIRRNWGDSIFRACRYALPNMETWTTVVIMIETMALLFYAALRRATPSPLLQTICAQILRDEVPHLRFQYERLGLLHASRGPLGMWLTFAAHRLLFLCIVLAVWIANHRVFRAGGATFLAYWRQSWRKMNHHWHQMRAVSEFVTKCGGGQYDQSPAKPRREPRSRLEGWLH